MVLIWTLVSGSATTWHHPPVTEELSCPSRPELEEGLGWQTLDPHKAQGRGVLRTVTGNDAPGGAWSGGGGCP